MALTLSRVAEVLREHLDPEDPLAPYPERLEDPRLRQTVRGYMTGSLDLVARIAGGDRPRFAVLDYKTNWLGEPDEPLTVDAYRPAAIGTEMQRHHYALQALLYLVALHRYLRWRLPGYGRDLGRCFIHVVFILIGAEFVQLRAPFGVLIVEIPVIVQLLIVETELCFLKHFLSLLSSGHVHP